MDRMSAAACREIQARYEAMRRQGFGVRSSPSCESVVGNEVKIHVPARCADGIASMPSRSSKGDRVGLQQEPGLDEATLRP